MMSATNRLHRLFFLISLLTVGAALSATGCLWGVVKDGTTGAPVSGAERDLRGFQREHGNGDHE